jgi:hypothetical protein
MDIFPAYFSAVRYWIPEADSIVYFDGFNVGQFLSTTVDLMHRAEHEVLLKPG